MDGIMRKLPIGIQTFAEIREENYLYVDKTAFVWRIANTDAPYCQVRLFLRICLQESTSTPFNGLFRQSAALSLLRLHVTP